MKFTSIATAIYLTIQCTSAFVIHNPQRTPSHSTITTLSSSSSTNTSASSSTNIPDLCPDFQSSLTQVTKALTSAIDTPYLEGPLVHFTTEYFSACNEANRRGYTDITPETTSKNMMDAVHHAMTYGLNDKYTFGVTHTALRGNDPEEEEGNTIDFYKFGNDFFRPAIDTEHSLVLGEEALRKAVSQLEAGENVIFLANHQSEADPQVMSILLDDVGLPKNAANIVFVAGHKVTTDLLAIPFSMGRNLICIHSKKHIDADPESKPIKQKQNLAAMNGMLKKLKKGGAAIWVAPSGGRDRRNVESGEVPIAPFDQKTVDMFRLMGNKSKVPTHFYALSMVTYDLCPPPDFVQAGVGEQRNVRFVPVAIKVNDELENVGGVESRHLFTDMAFERCQEGYDECLEALKKKGEE